VQFLSFSDILQIAAADYEEALIFLQEFTCYRKEKDIDQREKGEDSWSPAKCQETKSAVKKKNLTWFGLLCKACERPQQRRKGKGILRLHTPAQDRRVLLHQP
jgi:hypothetical protein